MPSVRTTLAMGLAMASAAAAQVNPHNPNTPKDPGNSSTSSTTSGTMGPAVFLWPDDRVWDARMDNSPPCGSIATPGNRTRFPLKGGAVRLVAQDDYYESVISISYLENPKENKLFKIIKGPQGMDSLDPGHTCFNLPDPDEKLVKNGTNATLQIVYIADWDTPGTNQTYACADITYVEGELEGRVSCFNATEPGENDRKATDAGSSRTASSSSGGPSGDGSGGSSGGSKLRGGALAAAIVSPIVGVSMLAAGLLLYRRKQQHKRSMRLARME